MTLSYEQIGSICRTCLKENANGMFSIYDEIEHFEGTKNEKIVIQQLIEDVAAFKVEAMENDINLPTLICIDCKNLLQSALDFRQQCNKSKEILRHYVIESVSQQNEIFIKEFEALQQEEDIKYFDVNILEDKSLVHALSKIEGNLPTSKRAKKEKKALSINLNVQLCKCEICNKVFRKKSNFLRHIKSHEEENSTCHICSKTFRHAKLLEKHLRTHTDERPYMCKVCGRTFKQSSSVSFHMRTHTGERPYLCTECGKGFIQNSELKSHMRTHTKEKPYMCSICGFRMADNSTFIKHVRRHTGEKPYKCSNCDKSFTSSSHLKRHAIIHTGLKPYTCEACKKSFNKKSNLRMHEKIHTNVRPHVCQLCGKGFIQAHCLRSHLLTHKP